MEWGNLCPLVLFCLRRCFSTEAKSNIWGRVFTDAITARHWSSGLHVGKHVLSHPEKSLAWQALLQSMTRVPQKAKTTETQLVSKNNTKIRALKLVTLWGMIPSCPGPTQLPNLLPGHWVHLALQPFRNDCTLDSGLGASSFSSKASGGFKTWTRQRFL